MNHRDFAHVSGQIELVQNEPKPAKDYGKAEIWSRYLQDREEPPKNAPAVSGGERLTFIISKNISILSRKKLKRGRSKATSR